MAPLDHYWSLAIEEQFYWLWPVALVAILRLPRRGRSTVVLTLTVLAGLAAPLIAWRWGSAAAYWATPARLAEILVGVAVAVALDHRWAARRRLPRWVRWLAPAGLLVIMAAAVTWPSDSGPAYRGWMPLFALASAALIVGLQVDGPVRRVFAHPTLVSLGVISYGVYLYHWPVYGLLDEQRIGWSAEPLFVLRVGVTLALATASFLWLEEPIRRRRRSFRQSLTAAVAITVPVAMAAVLLPIDRPGFWTGSADAREAVAIDDDAPLTPVVPGGVAAGTDFEVDRILGRGIRHRDRRQCRGATNDHGPANVASHRPASGGSDHLDVVARCGHDHHPGERAGRRCRCAGPPRNAVASPRESLSSATRPRPHWVRGWCSSRQSAPSWPRCRSGGRRHVASFAPATPRENSTISSATDAR